MSTDSQYDPETGGVAFRAQRLMPPAQIAPLSILRGAGRPDGSARSRGGADYPRLVVDKFNLRLAALYNFFPRLDHTLEIAAMFFIGGHLYEMTHVLQRVVIAAKQPLHDFDFRWHVARHNLRANGRPSPVGEWAADFIDGDQNWQIAGRLVT